MKCYIRIKYTLPKFFRINSIKIIRGKHSKYGDEGSSARQQA
jgi:hypothetical protein